MMTDVRALSMLDPDYRPAQAPLARYAVTMGLSIREALELRSVLRDAMHRERQNAELRRTMYTSVGEDQRPGAALANAVRLALGVFQERRESDPQRYKPGPIRTDEIMRAAKTLAAKQFGG
jgi:hypothetical protein